MARPVKIGIEYFPLDVDLFEDEKIIPISSEFGAKGECVLIRVLCAIYRNGYFAECSETFKYKIAKQANVSQNLVSEVIQGLVKWGFFNETVFNSFNVITSQGIQKRWKEATRKRVSKNELDYWILEFPTQKQEFLAEETPLNQSESTQKKRKEIKVKEIKRGIEKNTLIFSQIELIPIQEIKIKILSDELMIEQICMNLHIDKILFNKVLNDYFDEQIAKGIENKSLKDVRSHLVSWFNYHKKKYKDEQKQQTVYEA